MLTAIYMKVDERCNLRLNAHFFGEFAVDGCQYICEVYYNLLVKPK